MGHTALESNPQALASQNVRPFLAGVLLSSQLYNPIAISRIFPNMRLHRIIPVLLYREGSIVRSQQFSHHYKIGDPYQQLKRYLTWDADEIVYLDVNPEANNSRPLLANLPKIFNDCFAPVATGGSIHTLGDIERHLESGADRVVLGGVAVRDPAFVDNAAKRYGSQAIIVSVDYRQSGEKQRTVCIRNGREPTDKQLVNWVDELHQRGAGEILLHAIDRDGMGGGYDLPLISELSQKLSVPLIVCGGASSYQHFTEAISHGASAVAASNIFCFKELAYEHAKEAMIAADQPVRPPLSETE